MTRISNVDQWNVCLNLLLDPSVSEIVANGPEEFFVTRSNQRMRISEVAFSSREEYSQSIEKGLIPHIRSDVQYNPTSYLYEGPLEYTVGETKVKGRCHIALAPAADSPQITIAKKSTSLTSIEDIASQGSMASEMLMFLKAAVKANLTMVFSGGTGAGKTTMLEALTKLIPSNYRIGVAEDTPELVLTQPNVTYLHSVPWRPGMDPNNVASLSWVVQQFQRMRISKVIIGETRGKEFADFLTAANSGMPGSFTTIHADDPVLCLDKMTNFAIKGSERQPIRSINADIANAIDIIVQLNRLPDGRHKVSAIQEITSTIGKGEDAKITTQTLYKYDPLTDQFFKDMHMTDSLRQKFANASMDFSPFLATRQGTPLSQEVKREEVAQQSVQSSYRRGLPTGPGQGGRRSL